MHLEQMRNDDISIHKALTGLDKLYMVFGKKGSGISIHKALTGLDNAEV